MADALCGPSNALQNFQKHTSVDRSLQQDRFGVRQNSGQTFRSSPAPGSSHVDAEFQAFQAGHPILRERPVHPPQFMPQPLATQTALPSWAQDFQQLRLNEPNPTSYASLPSAALAGQAGSMVGGWQNEFLKQQHAPTQRLEASPMFQSPMWQPQMPTYSPLAQGQLDQSLATQQHQMTQHTDNQEFQFDDAAFARAFEAVDSQLDESQSKGKEKEIEREPVVKFDLSHASVEMGDITGEYDYDSQHETPWASELQSTRREVGWEALDAYQRAHEVEFQSTGNQESLNIYNTIQKMRTDEERSSQTQTPEPQVERFRIGADTIPASQQQAEPANNDTEADDLARTAGQLIDSLKDEQSTKFQQSNFMELMRQLRDKEVRVEGDAMVSVSIPNIPSASDKASPSPAGPGFVKQAPHPGGKFYPSDAFNLEAPESGEAHTFAIDLA